ncbi:hypothetical protein EA756_11690 [Acinetobacter lactucae]|uniref:Uncharacterized protein n=1 Tax=Acinetobacter lactucae TaxID=1785128 RepID=A0A429JYT0_9GAMM|nr:hypothetical protein [Acinetobacter lactucae]RSO56349.1 hypothetical protein EA756_11690 [Acinetobacter lactucae]
MSYLVIKELGYKIFLAKKGNSDSKNAYVVFTSDKEMFVGVESYTYDAPSNKLLWEGIQDLGLVIVGFADTEEEALDLAF